MTLTSSLSSSVGRCCMTKALNLPQSDNTRSLRPLAVRRGPTLAGCSRPPAVTVASHRGRRDAAQTGTRPVPHLPRSGARRNPGPSNALPRDRRPPAFRSVRLPSYPLRHECCIAPNVTPLCTRSRGRMVHGRDEYTPYFGAVEIGALSGSCSTHGRPRNAKRAVAAPGALPRLPRRGTEVQHEPEVDPGPNAYRRSGVSEKLQSSSESFGTSRAGSI